MLPRILIWEAIKFQLFELKTGRNFQDNPEIMGV